MAVTPLSRRLRQRNDRVESHRHLVRPVAIHYARRCRESSEDLMQVGLLGLIRAAELYSEERSTPFCAFARPHIRGAILHYLRDTAPSVRLPRRQAELQERLIQLERLRAADPAAGADLQRELGIGAEQWRVLQQHRRLSRPCSLEEASIDHLAAVDEEPAVEEEAGAERILALLDQLEERQRRVVRQVVLAGWSYRRLAAELGVSAMTVQRLLRRGLDRLRELLDAPEGRPAVVRAGDRAGCAPSAPRGC